MRCFEMVRNNLNIEIRGLLNNNMRCFEIQVNGKNYKEMEQVKQ